MRSRVNLRGKNGVSLVSRVPLALLIWLVMFLLILLSHRRDTPEILGAFLALSLLVIIPQQLGALVVRAFLRLVRDLPSPSDTVSLRFFCWLVGVFFLTMAALLLQMVSLPSVIKKLPWLVLGIVTISLGDDVMRTHLDQSGVQRLPRALPHGRVALLVLVIGLLPVLLHKYFVPFPLIQRGASALPKIVVQPVRWMIEDSYIMWNFPVHKSELNVHASAKSSEGVRNVTRRIGKDP